MRRFPPPHLAQSRQETLVVRFPRDKMHLVICFIAALLCACASAQKIRPEDGPVAKLPNGIQFQGTTEEKGDAFRGIRYATAARFTPPQIYVATENVDATKLGQVCPQGSCTNTGCSEDCLMLNIFTGNNATANAVATGALLPVAIFVHGGSYNSGTGNIYPGGPLAHYWDGKGIVVTINYRLGAFGFAGGEQLRKLDTNGGSTGNYGIQDQRMAFRWVQENIAAFGGDKKKVMIFGESAGAGSMTMHLTMKKSFGLYSRVVAESGAFAQWNMQPMAQAQKYFEDLLVNASCDTSADQVACLQALSMDDVQKAYKAIYTPDTDPYIYGPTVDGVEATQPAWLAAANGGVNPVPIMFGTNRDEGSMFCDLNKEATQEDLTAWWKTYSVGPEALNPLYVGKPYPTVAGYSDFWWAGMRSLGDMAMSCPANYASASLHAKQPVYQYWFTHVSKYATKHDDLVIHGSELPFVLQVKNVFDDMKDREMSNMMASYWGNFLMSESGNPNEHHVGLKLLAKWPQYTEKNPVIMNLDEADNSKPINDLKKEECDYWIPFVDNWIKTTKW